MTARALALQALADWRQGREFADVIIQRSLGGSGLGKSDRAFANELFYGIIRNLSLLDFWIDRTRSEALDHESRDLLRLGFYQLFILRTASHAAVFETVELSRRRNRGLVNGVLRAALRREDELRAAAEAQPLAIRASHPGFLIERWKNAFGADAASALCHWNNEPAPIYARLNNLHESELNFGEHVFGREDFVRVTDIPLDSLARGECYIQDPSTALSCELLDAQPDDAVLDACAAPGGKTSLIAQAMQNRGQLLACDREPSRVTLLGENLRRLGVNATVLQHDWKTGVSKIATTFDRILVDAPCTNTGVIRRRVDVRWRLTSDDFTRLPLEQLAILRAVAPLLKAGGVLVYSTCSLEAEENEEVVRRALSEFPFLRLESQQAILPFRDGFDGAFAAKLRRA